LEPTDQKRDIAVKPIIKYFPSSQQLEQQLIPILQEQFTNPNKHIVTICGGSTPAPIYQKIAQMNLTKNPNLYILQSDERYVPNNSPQSNYKIQKQMVKSLITNPKQFIHPDCSLPINASVNKFATQIKQTIANKTTLSFALLGMGNDGHFASIFNQFQLQNAKNKIAISTIGADKLTRITISQDIIIQTKTIRFLINQTNKQQIVNQLSHTPQNILTWNALKNHPDLQFWIITN